MKSKSRRELINEIKYYKETAVMQQNVIESQRAIMATKDRHKNFLMARLERLGDDKNIRHTKAPDRGTVEKYVTIAPEHVKTTDVFNRYNATYAREILCQQIAKALVDGGLVRFETKPFDMNPEYLQVTARVDVIPWDLLCERVVVNRDKSEITVERGRG